MSDIIFAAFYKLVGMFIFAMFVVWIIDDSNNVDYFAQTTTVVNYSTCKVKKERPRIQTIIGEESTGYDCLD